MSRLNFKSYRFYGLILLIVFVAFLVIIGFTGNDIHRDEKVIQDVKAELVLKQVFERFFIVNGYIENVGSQKQIISHGIPKLHVSIKDNQGNLIKTMSEPIDDIGIETRLKPNGRIPYDHYFTYLGKGTYTVSTELHVGINEQRAEYRLQTEVTVR